MSQYRKKPVVIEARQWSDGDGTDAQLRHASISKAKELIDWVRAGGGPLARFQSGDVYTGKARCIVIPTLEGDMTASENDWIIRGVAGEFYPCKPDIFDATYEPVDGDS